MSLNLVEKADLTAAERGERKGNMEEKQKRKTHTSSAVKNRYNAKAYDRITLVVKKGEKKKIQKLAEKADLSVNAYITAAIYAYERD
jgi:hypothetical protein